MAPPTKGQHWPLMTRSQEQINDPPRLAQASGGRIWFYLLKNNRGSVYLSRGHWDRPAQGPQREGPGPSLRKGQSAGNGVGSRVPQEGPLGARTLRCGEDAARTSVRVRADRKNREWHPPAITPR